jgi:hypothetical protein
VRNLGVLVLVRAITSVEVSGGDDDDGRFAVLSLFSCPLRLLRFF